MTRQPFQYRNPDGTLRLDELLGEQHVRHYTRVLESSSDEFRAMQLAMKVPDVHQEAPGYFRPPPPRGVMTDDGWLMTAEGAAEAEASSCTALALRPDHCWDVCGYYRALGVHWRATRKEVLAAQIRLDPWRDRRRDVSYAVDQLLDPVIRRAYDLMPLGGLFMGDRDVRARIEKLAAMEASRRNAEAWAAGEDRPEPAALGRVLGEWGFTKDLTPDEARDRLAGEPFRRGRASDELGSSRGDWESSWGWYRLTDPYDPDDGGAPSPAVLEAWQAMVSGALAAAGQRVSFAVGTWPGTGAHVLQVSKERCIFLIGKGEITREMATVAVMGFLARVKTSGSSRRSMNANPR
ncbi:MAG: hypothetical protein JWM19_855 [Actinomycetia bacterium]|nr:hypothetical protein [Actinomycetes bacterium]